MRTFRVRFQSPESRRSTCTLALILLAVAAVSPPALGAGKNDGGAMLVHTQNALAYTGTMTPCGATWETYAPAACEDVVTQADLGNETDRQLIWYIAAFHPSAQPGVTVVFFGHDHNFPPGEGWFTGSFCGPANSLEVPDAGWPEQVSAGNSVAFGSAVTGQHFFPFYYFTAYAFAGAYMATGINPTGGYASFVSDDSPGFQDRIDKFGTLRFYEAGETTCPEPPAVGACCLSDATCQILLETDCEGAFYNGQYQGDGTDCETTPCGACCWWRRTDITFFRNCVVTGRADCEEGEWAQHKVYVETQQDSVGSNWSFPGTICAQNAEEADVNWWCEDPRQNPTATEETSWGRLKTLFR